MVFLIGLNHSRREHLVDPAPANVRSELFLVEKRGWKLRHTRPGLFSISASPPSTATARFANLQLLGLNVLIQWFLCYTCLFRVSRVGRSWPSTATPAPLVTWSCSNIKDRKYLHFKKIICLGNKLTFDTLRIGCDNKWNALSCLFNILWNIVSVDQWYVMAEADTEVDILETSLTTIFSRLNPTDGTDCVRGPLAAAATPPQH